MEIDQFKQLLRQKGEELYRDMPWRGDTRPYYVLVSELMLQQTQVGRVVPKFEEFITKFPDEKTLARASLGDVLRLWQGLGYNRRAKFLHEAAKMIVSECDGIFLEDETDILKLPGIGKNTAGAILAYAFNRPSMFVETNIRTVYIHHFFADDFDVSDKQIIEKIEQTIDRKNPRQFYQNLMDYGTWLKANGVRNIDHSRHYKKQAALKGSLREMRGEIIRRLSLEYPDWQVDIGHDPRFDEALAGLVHDGLVEQTEFGDFHLTK